jgi:hypothetical protein
MRETKNTTQTPMEQSPTTTLKIMKVNIYPNSTPEIQLLPLIN